MLQNEVDSIEIGVNPVKTTAETPATARAK
jgi:hypothetical protein